MSGRRVLILAGVGLAIAAAARIIDPGPAPVAVAVAPAAGRAPSPASVAPSAAGSTRWSVKVDGWTIQVDQVAGLAFPDPPALPAEMPSLLSPYDRMIARYAAAAGFDWRFIAALIYEESHFDPVSESEAGAYGLMQLLPAAAHDVDEPRFREPEANVRTGVRYLQRLEREYQPARDRDRQALMLASYNMGMGHVQDAQVLARRFGYDPYRWDGSMDVMVSLLEEPQAYERARNGAAQGRAVVAYVNRVLERYAAYRRTLPAELPVAIRVDG